jgi:hypothetical protein
LLATDVVLTDGSSTSLVQQAEAAGANTLMMTGNPERIIEFDGRRATVLVKAVSARSVRATGAGNAFVRLTKAAALSRPISPDQTPRPCFLQLVRSWRAL